MSNIIKYVFLLNWSILNQWKRTEDLIFLAEILTAELLLTHYFKRLSWTLKNLSPSKIIVRNLPKKELEEPLAAKYERVKDIPGCFIFMHKCW